jgi:hypothetical protein
MPATHEDIAGGKVPCGLQGWIPPEIPRAGGDRIHAGSNALQQRGFPTAVLAHQKRHRHGEGQLLKAVDERKRPGKPVSVNGGVSAPTQG